MMKINFKKFLLAFLFVVAGVMTVSAIPAHPQPMDVTQSDGSRLTVRLVGDEFYHRTMTTDGYTLLQRSNGDYVYAIESGSRLVASDVVAHNPMMRNAGTPMESMSPDALKKPSSVAGNTCMIRVPMSMMPTAREKENFRASSMRSLRLAP